MEEVEPTRPAPSQAPENLDARLILYATCPPLPLILGSFSVPLPVYGAMRLSDGVADAELLREASLTR